MTGPAEAAGRFLWACLLGLGLGAVYDFLRPLRPRHTHLSDGVFLAAAVWAWVYLSFGICRGDLRLGYTAGLAAGGLVWVRTAGRMARPLFSGFWKFIGGLLRKTAIPLKKISEFLKILFASGEKWVTIRWNNRRHPRRRPGGTPYGKRDPSKKTVPD